MSQEISIVKAVPVLEVADVGAKHGVVSESAWLLS